jgi:Zn-dependent M28 family amino/carboxypeptidase
MRWVSEKGDVQGIYPPVAASVVFSPAGIEKLLDGGPLTPAGIQQQAAESQTGSANLPVSMTIRRKSTQTTRRSANVAGILRGSDPGLSKEFVVMTAHLDHIGIGPEIDGDTIYNGAYDNATGVAYLLEVARVLVESDIRPARSIMFLAVSGEEKGLLGSDYFADNPTVAIGNIVANVNLDMPLFIYPPADVVAFGAEHSSLETVVDKAATKTGFTLSPDPIPEEVIFVRSDQYPFVRKGIPAVYLMPGFTSSDADRDGREEFMHFLGTIYHKPNDEVSLPFDEESAVRFGLLNLELVIAIANDPKRPSWNEGDFFGEKFGQRNE